jgi:hypothetical protein
MRAHNAIGNMISFALFRIIRLAYGELGVNDACAQQLLHGLIANLLLHFHSGMRGGLRLNGRARVRRCSFAMLCLLRIGGCVFHLVRSQDS